MLFSNVKDDIQKESIGSYYFVIVSALLFMTVNQSNIVVGENVSFRFCPSDPLIAKVYFYNKNVVYKFNSHAYMYIICACLYYFLLHDCPLLLTVKYAIRIVNNEIFIILINSSH